MYIIINMCNITFKPILMIPVRIDALLNCTDENISIRSENSL